MQRVAVVIPYHEEVLGELEKISLAQCLKVLGHYPIIYAVPEGTNFAWIPEGSQVIHMPHLGKGIEHYNILLKSPQFYEYFLDYEYILIYQLDAFVFYDALEYFCSLGYDYIGAPWSKMHPAITKRKERKLVSRVGNGGFSLRKVKAHYDLLKNHPDLVEEFPYNRSSTFCEDHFFSYCGKRYPEELHVAPYNVACEFSIDHEAQKVIKKNGGHFPFACHKWFAYNADVFAPLIQKLGYDLRPLKHLLDNLDNDLIRRCLIEAAMDRLKCKLRHDGGKGIIKYLPTREFASVLVVTNDETIKIFEELYSYEDAPDKITLHKDLTVNFYDRISDLVNDLKAKSLPQLIIDPLPKDYYSVLNDDNYLLSRLEKRGLRYGEHVLSFRREYLKYCEKIFHKLGK